MKKKKVDALFVYDPLKKRKSLLVEFKAKDIKEAQKELEKAFKKKK